MKTLQFTWGLSDL